MYGPVSYTHLDVYKRQEINDIWYPKHLSLEQCSSEVTAHYKATLLKGNSLTDLTGGFGIDCSFLAAKFQSVTYVERQKDLCEIAIHNFPILNLKHIDVRNEDGVDYLNAMSPVDCIFLDPARRNGQDVYKRQVFNAAPLVDCMPRRYRLHVGFLPVKRRFFVHTLLNNSHIFHSFGEFVERAEVSVNGERNKLVRRQIGILIRNSISHK